MTQMIFVRHGQTTYNVSHIYCGQLDCSLTEQGYAQAEELKDHILSHGIHIDAIWSSDLQRSRATVAPIAEALSLPISLHAGLREIQAGDFTDKELSLVKELYPDLIKKLSDSDLDMRYPNGESLYEARQRIYATAEEIAKKSIGKTVLIASHAGVINSLVRESCKRSGRQELTSLVTPNCSLTIFEYENGVITLIRHGVRTVKESSASVTESKNKKDITVV